MFTHDNYYYKFLLWWVDTAMEGPVAEVPPVVPIVKMF